MEVVGAVASAITLAQVAVKGVSILQQIPEIKADYADLCSEIAFIEYIIRSVGDEKNYQTKYIGYQIQQAGAALQEISSTLNDTKVKCERLTAKGGSRPSKSKWLVYKGRVASVLQRAHRAKTNLILAVQMHSTMLNRETSLQIGEMNRSLYAIYNQGSVAIQSEHVDSSTTDDSSSRVQVLDIGCSQNGHGVGGEQSQVSGRAQNSPLVGEIIQQDTFQVSQRKPCPRECGCHCHIKPWHFSTPQWTRQVTGSWEVKYKTHTSRNRWELLCPCRNNQMDDLQVIWKPPAWWWVRCWFPQHSYPLQCALRTPRTIPWYFGREWDVLLANSEEKMRYAMRQGTMFFPDDQDENGISSIEALINNGAFNCLEILLSEWRSILTGQRLSGNVGHTAYHVLGLLRQGREEEREVRLLQQVISYADPDMEMETTALHEATRRGVSIQEALQAVPSDAIDMLDRAGYAPLHYSAMFGNIQAVEELLNAGANVNCKGSDGWTPLMFAANNNNTELMSRLLLAKCRIHEKNRIGRTALHEAAWKGRAEAVQLLLQQGASPSVQDNDGNTPLHFAVQAEREGASANKSDATIQLLINAPSTDINATNSKGRTPVCIAVMSNSLIALRPLTQANALFTCTDSDLRNILHIAASVCNLELLLFLDSQNLFDINWYCNKAGFTPWDGLISVINTSSWEMLTSILRKPSQEEMIAFTQLYRGIRDRDLSYVISILQEAVAALHRRNSYDACRRIEKVIHRKQSYGDSEGAQFYRGIKNEVQAGGWKVPLNWIEQDIQELRAELASSPWDQRTRFDSPDWSSSDSDLSDNDSDASESHFSDEDSV